MSLLCISETILTEPRVGLIEDTPASSTTAVTMGEAVNTSGMHGVLQGACVGVTGPPGVQRRPCLMCRRQPVDGVVALPEYVPGPPLPLQDAECMKGGCA